MARPTLRELATRVARGGSPSVARGGRAVGEDSTVFIGIDAAKAKHAVAVAEPGRGGEVRYLGEIEASPEAVRKLITRLAGRHGRPVCCMGRRIGRTEPYPGAGHA